MPLDVLESRKVGLIGKAEASSLPSSLAALGLGGLRAFWFCDSARHVLTGGGSGGAVIGEPLR